MFRVPLGKIQDNPFQTRTEYGNIPELAASIMKMSITRPETLGLVQVPPARLWDVDAGAPLVVDTMTADEIGELLDNGAVVQLAAGHRRYRAFLHLALTDPTFAKFPVELGFYTDENMADLVWTENHDRADLSAIEEAEALQRDMQAFGWTQQQIADRRNMSRSAVANKLRLLGLPDDAKTAIRSGQLTERHGRVLLKAQSLTPQLYQELADNLIPLPVADEIAEKARQLQSDDKNIFSIHNRQEPCALCGTITKIVIRANGADTWLCKACMRVATGWEPASVADTDARLRRLIDAHAKHIDFFPMDQDIGSKTPCTGCPMLDQRGSKYWQCINGECHQYKTETWQIVLAGRLRNRIVDRWPDCFMALQVDFKGYSGHEMDDQDDVDKYLAAHVCNPKCQHFIMRYHPYEFCHYIKLTEMPFICVCDNTGSRNACARKLGKDQEAQAELAKHNAALAESEKRKQEIMDMRKRTQNALRQAFAESKPGIWLVLAQAIKQNAKDPFTTIADWLLEKEFPLYDVNMVKEWDEASFNRHKNRITNTLGKWGLDLPPSADELIERMEKIARFYEEHREDMTPEQIAGNIANCEKLADDISQALTLKMITEADYNRLYLSVVDLRGRFVKLDNARLVNVFVSQKTPGKIQEVIIDENSEPGYVHVAITEYPMVSQETVPAR